MSNQLLPCPFCGGDAGENQHTDDCYFTARQAVIDAERGDVSGVPEMIKAWNRRAAQPAAGEPVYQVMYLGDGGGGWVDVDRQTMERNETDPKHFHTRTLWTAPPAAAHGDEAVRAKLCEAYESAYQDGQKWPDSYSIQADKDKVVDALIAAMRAQAGEGGEV